jgi:hypothetical protein
VAVAVDAGEVRSAGGATASGRHWRNERREVDEKSLRELFCYTIVKLCFIYAAPYRRPLPSTAGESRSLSRGRRPLSVPVRLA